MQLLHLRQTKRINRTEEAERVEAALFTDVAGAPPRGGSSCPAFLFCDLLLCFSLDRSKDPQKEPFSSEAGVLPARMRGPCTSSSKERSAPSSRGLPLSSPSRFGSTSEAPTRISIFMILTGLRHEKMLSCSALPAA